MIVDSRLKAEILRTLLSTCDVDVLLDNLAADGLSPTKHEVVTALDQMMDAGEIQPEG